MNTDSPPKKSSSRKKTSTKNAEQILRVTLNDWNPFERANPSVLEKVTQESTKQRINNYGEALI
jgi:hypothetical protein